MDQALPLFSAGRYVEVQALLEPYLAQQPQDLGARYWYARALLNVGQRTAAVAQFGEILAQKPDSSDSRFHLALALVELGQSQAAQAELAEVLRHDPQHVGARNLQQQLANPLPPGAPPPPPPGGQGRIALVTGGLPLDPGEVDLQTFNLRDYTFSEAPADWLITAGDWSTTSRWTCSPQWSWYGGEAKNSPAVIWTKEEFAGDIVVEVYVAFKMGVDVQGRSYKNPNDVNITICGDGGNLDSGYSFIVGGELNSVTQIMRGTEVLAATGRREVMFPDFNLGMPGTYQWHRKWWALRARKIGDLLQLYVDERLAVEVHDPEPLSAGRVAVWTYDNAVIIPRVRIYHQDTVRPRSEYAGQDGWIRPVEQVAERPLQLTSASHPALQNDFQFDLGGWKTLEADGGAVLTLAPREGSAGGQCLALINRAGGGNFGAMISEQSLDLRQHSRLSFDYRVPPEVKVNFYLAAASRWWEIVFTGLEVPSPRTRILGRIPNVVADGQWRRAEFDLLGALETALDGTVPSSISHFHLGNFSNQGYLMAGFGGNPAGATFYLDNFYLGTPKPERTVRLAAAPARGSEYSSYLISVDQDPLGKAGKSYDAWPEEITVPGSGQWYVHVQPTGANGKSPQVQHYAVRVDEAAPRLAASEPAGGSRLGGGEITLKLEEPDGSGLDPASLRLALNDKELKAGDPGVRLDLQTGRLQVDPAVAGIALGEGEELRVRLAALSDRAGNALAEPATLTYRYSVAADDVPPLAPQLTVADGDLLHLDFDEGLSGASPFGGAETVGLAVDPTTAASGRGSLRVTNLRTGGQFGITLVDRPFNAGQYRLVSFDYKIPPNLALDFGVSIDGQWRTIRFTGHDSPNVIGACENIVADNQWRHAEFNLYEMLRRADPTRSHYQVSRMVLSGWGWLGSPEGLSYNLDNFRISPIVSAEDKLLVAWNSPDLGGLDTVAWQLDTSSGTVPAEARPVEQPLTVTGVPLLDGFLHLRARDRAGNWSPVTSRRVLIDSQRPTAESVGPAEGQRVAPDRVRLRLQDPGPAGLDPQSIVLSVGGKDYRVAGEAVRYNSNSGELTWLCEKTEPQPTVFADGQTVEVALRAAKDFAGNPVTELPKWAWVMDYSQDRTGPVIADISSTTHQTFFSETFESGQTGPVQVRSGAEAKVVSENPASGQHSLELRKTGGGPMQVLLVGSTFAADKYPVLSFNYRLEPQARVNLVVVMAGRPYRWTFTGPSAGAIGQVEAVKADGQWHRANVVLSSALRGQQQQGALMVSEILLAEQGGGSPVGTRLWLDSIVVGTPGLGPVNCKWSATDPTGIKGYSYLLTQNPAEMPPDTLESNTTHQFPGAAAGVWFLRLRAQDGAGNWGPVATYAIISRGPG